MLGSAVSDALFRKILHFVSNAQNTLFLIHQPKHNQSVNYLAQSIALNEGIQHNKFGINRPRNEVLMILIQLISMSANH